MGPGKSEEKGPRRGRSAGRLLVQPPPPPELPPVGVLVGESEDPVVGEAEEVFLLIVE
jgi:hypothetical protein